MDFSSPSQGYANPSKEKISPGEMKRSMALFRKLAARIHRSTYPRTNASSVRSARQEGSRRRVRTRASGGRWSCDGCSGRFRFSARCGDGQNRVCARHDGVAALCGCLVRFHLVTQRPWILYRSGTRQGSIFVPGTRTWSDCPERIGGTANGSLPEGCGKIDNNSRGG
jgi:hypothetical protein